MVPRRRSWGWYQKERECLWSFIHQRTRVGVFPVRINFRREIGLNARLSGLKLSIRHTLVKILVTSFLT